MRWKGKHDELGGVLCRVKQCNALASYAMCWRREDLRKGRTWMKRLQGLQRNVSQKLCTGLWRSTRLGRAKSRPTDAVVK